NAEFLSRCEQFEAAAFVRFLRIKAADSEESLEPTVTGDEALRYELVGGSRYDLELFSYQPFGVDVPLQISAQVGDNVAVQIVGEPGFAIASNYDRPKVLLQAGRPTSGQKLLTPLVLYSDQSLAPRIDVTLEVRPSGRDKTLGL